MESSSYQKRRRHRLDGELGKLIISRVFNIGSRDLQIKPEKNTEGTEI